MNCNASLVRPVLLTLVFGLSWSAGAAPYEGKEKANNQSNQVSTSSECVEMRQERQNLLEEHRSGGNPVDYQEAKENMDSEVKKRFESLQTQMRRCR